MRTARAAVRLLGALPELAEKGNPNAASDVGAAALLLDACVEGALLNVGINLGGVEDPALVSELQKETAVLGEESQRLRSQVLAVVRKRVDSVADSARCSNSLQERVFRSRHRAEEFS